MKKKLLITIATAASLNGFAQNNPQVFYGGTGDGFSRQSYAQSSINTMFNGNAGDGFSRSSYTQQGGASQFFGGNGDGWNKNNYAQASINTMFFGGNGDGFNSNNYTQQGSNTQFFGGNGDGWNKNNYSQSYPDFAYRGGVGDGWASNYTPLAPLPVTFLSFEASKAGNTSLLTWRLASDEEVVSFDVERSNNAVNFEKIGNVSQSSTAKNRYDFTDKQPLMGNNYYRLRVLNKNGKQEYTGTRVVNFEQTKRIQLSIYPNPATDVVNVELPNEFANAQYIVVNMYGMNGAMVYQRKMAASGVLEIKIPIEQLAGGNYVVHLAADNARTADGKVTILKR